jgi:hypothetical protein
MTKEELKSAIEFGQYTDARINGRGGSEIRVNGEHVTVNRDTKKAFYCIMVDLSDEAIEKIAIRSLENSINDKKSELAALEIQYDEMLKGGK